MKISCTTAVIATPEAAIAELAASLDTHLGVLLASGFDFPGRYSRWDIGFSKPPIQLISKGLTFQLISQNDRGVLLLEWINDYLHTQPNIQIETKTNELLTGSITPPPENFIEEDRSKQNSIFTLIRALLKLFSCPEDPYIGLYGAFGYDLSFQFDPITFQLPRDATQRDLVLYIPDEIIVFDHSAKSGHRRSYEFDHNGQTTAGKPRTGKSVPFTPGKPNTAHRSHKEGEYADVVRAAKPYFERGDLFEVVPSHSFYEPCLELPSKVFTTLITINPAPYSCLMNLGEQEYMVGASPEMFVRTQGKRVETCPIAGTIQRGKDAIEDAKQILTLLSSEKERSELMMCTDVDRNDKSRVCIPGSVRVIGHRQIEMYSKLIHTVDHVEGILKDDCDAIDAFLSHAWAVTLTGAPKLWAMRFIEAHEKSPRHWYGGAIGMIGFDGNINTGITLRTMRIKNGEAEVRAGATLLMDADPDAEEKETEIKAAAARQALQAKALVTKAPDLGTATPIGDKKRLLLIDYEDSFVHTLANYFRQTGIEVTTIRTGFTDEKFAEILRKVSPHIAVLSPGPGSPKHFGIHHHIDLLRAQNIPIFGICLGLQSLVEYFGGTLSQLPYPVHGKESKITITPSGIFEGLPTQITVGRYHSLIANPSTFPHSELKITAATQDNIIMAIEHHSLPVAAVQFHPESLMTLLDHAGLIIIKNVIQKLTQKS